MGSVATARKVRLSQAEVDAIARALADPRRFAILKQIASSATCACSSLNEHSCLSPATVSHHMKELSEAGLVEIVREGRTATLSLRREVWDAYVEQLSAL